MAKTIANAVFDAALGIIDNSTHCEVRTSADSVLVSLDNNSVTLDAGNFTIASGATGRKITCLESSASDMQLINVSTTGAAERIAIGISSASSIVDYVVTELSSAVSITSADQINLGSFSVTLADPT